MRRGGALAMTLVLVLLASGQASAHPDGRERRCAVRWGSLDKVTPAAPSAPLVDVRVGGHDYFDRLVLDIAGDPGPGYHVGYTDHLSGVGTGARFAVKGGATLTIAVTAPGRDALVIPTVPWGAGEEIVSQDELVAAGFRAFRSVVYGGSFERRSVLGLGLRARLPFRVFRLGGPGTGSRVVIDVAHVW